jgi:hypothetical protein
MGIGVLDTVFSYSCRCKVATVVGTFIIRYTAPEHGCMLWNLSYRGENLDSVLFIILFSLIVVSSNLDEGIPVM